MNRNNCRAITLLALLAGSPAVAAPADEAEVLKLDPVVVTGKLQNGLTYYVRRNVKPEKRAEIWLAVNAGSVLEDDDQRGLAHFVEHMAFNGTKSFKKHEIVDYLESIGMRFGPDVNAYTSFDETVYMLTVPTDSPAIMEKAFSILLDWAQGVSFEAEEIEKERGVVIEEWRMGRGAEARMMDRQIPVILKGSRYAERLPIGQKEIIEKASHDLIRRFYADWYRPDLMAVIAVGDIDTKAVEKTIRERFAALSNPAAPRPRETQAIPDHDETLVAVATDPEAGRSVVSILHKLEKKSQATASDYRRLLVEELYHSMFNARLDEIRLQADAPFVFAFSQSSSFARTKDMMMLAAGVREGGIVTGIETLVREVERVDRHGFAATELDRVKKDLLRSYEQAYAERDKSSSSGYAREAASHFLDGEPMPGIEVELALVRRYLPDIRIDEVNNLARDALGERNRVLLANAPQKAGVGVPDEAALLAAARSIGAAQIQPWIDSVRDEPLVAVAPKPGAIVEEKKAPEIGVTRWKLSNGVQVLLKPTDFKNDEVLLSGFSPGGHSLVSDERFISARSATSILGECGLGAFSQVELQKALAGKVADAGVYIGELEEGVDGSASPSDIETMFQLVYLNLAAPRIDEHAFSAWKLRERTAIENRLSRPEVVFGDKMSATMSQGHPRRLPPSLDTLAQVDLQAAAAAYRERFSDCGDFTFVIVGNFSEDAIRPLVLTWLGGLPATGRVESWKDVGVRPPEGVIRFDVKKGIEPKSIVRIVFTGPAKWSRGEEHGIRSLAEAMRIRLREVLREDLGGVYGVGVSGGISRRPVEMSSYSISFGCAPERAAELEKAVFDVIEAVKSGGVASEIISKVREAQTRKRETDLKENHIWQMELMNACRYGTDPALILKHGELVEGVTSDVLRDAARRYLSKDRYVVGVLLPEQ